MTTTRGRLRGRAAFAAAIVALSAAACGGRHEAAPLTALAVEPLAAPTPGDSAVLQLTSASGRTIVSWVETTGPVPALQFAERTAQGWSAPMTVVSGEELIVNPADVPSVRALANGALVAQWLKVNGDDPEAYDLLLSWSSDGGRTWTPAVSPHDDGTKSQHGFASFFDMPHDPRFGLVWLDGRNAPSGLIGDMALRGARYASAGAQSDQAVLDPRVCECCPTAAAATSEGVIVAYRDRSPDEIRDIHVVRSEGDGWSKPVAVHNDGWKISGCPVNGPAISAQGLNVAVAWFTVHENVGHAYVAFSTDGGRRFGEPVRLDENASTGRVQVALLEDGTAVATWVESAAGTQAIRVRRVGADGGRGPASQLAERPGRQFPRLVRAGRELLFAWVEDSADLTHMKMARVPL